MINMTKAIILDFWGTLVEQGVRSPVKQIRYILHIRVPFSEYITRMERAMMTKEFSTLEEAFKSVCQEFKIQVNERRIEELIGMWNKNWMLAQPYEETKEVLQSLKEKYQLVLVANSDNKSIKNVLEKFDLTEYFNKIFYSYELGMIKTNPEFLKKVLSDLHLQPEECIFIGDSMQSDITPAKTAGIPAILVDRRDSRDFSPKVTNLKELEL